MKIFNLPDLGEGLPDAEIVQWHVQIGDSVKLDQILVSVETAKAVVEVPSPIEGRIKHLFGKAGDLMHTGAPLVEFDLTDHNTTIVTVENVGLVESIDESNSSDRRNNAATAAGELEIGDTVIQEQSLIQKQRLAGRVAQNNQHGFNYTQTNVGNNTGIKTGNNVAAFSGPNQSIKATPAIRALAQQMQIDLGFVSGSGPNGTITKQDLEQAVAVSQQAGPFEQLKGVRRAMAQSMAKSHAEVVPITVMDDAKLLLWPENEDITVRIIQAIIEAYQKEPDLNAWFDAKAMARRIIKELHLGIAMDTAEGLFVPVIHNAEKLNKVELRAELEKLKKKVKDRTIAPQDLRGATFTLSNVGIFAGRYANPVVIPPTVAILAVGKIRDEVVALEGQIRICKVMPLALTFDHRAVTGGEATRFLASMMQSLSGIG
jgi:2-oxoisovalerate dehydrogenase E2 component (dihydrolipoyl transacylase)